jgi:predicted nucleic acid-binding protein
VSILDEWVVFDTNIWIFGLRRVPQIPACAQLLEHLNRLFIVLPRQILQELQANLSEDEIRILFRLLSRIPHRLKINWEKAHQDTIAKYQRLGCRLGDAVIAAHLEELGIKILISENRNFLRKVKELPFRRISAAQAIVELEQKGP